MMDMADPETESAVAAVVNHTARTLASTILARAAETPDGHRHLVAIAGPPGAGKSTLAGALTEHLNTDGDFAAALVGMDGFHFDDRVLKQRGWHDRKGAPHTFDVAGLAVLLGRLRRIEPEPTAIPVFDRSIEISRAGAALIGPDIRVVIVEGNYLLLDQAPWSSLAAFFGTTVMLTAAPEALAARLDARWRHYGLSAEQIRRKLDGNDLPNARTVLELSRKADIVIGT